jgi:fimbrial chaperone protein
MNLPRLHYSLRHLCIGVCIFLSLVFPTLADTPNFSVRPIRVDLDNEQRIGSLTVSNGGDVPRLVRVEADVWEQVNGIDRYTPAKDDLIIVPPILSIEAGQDKLVRLGLRHFLSGTRERTYRVFITDIPPKKFRSSGVQVAFRMSIPVFVNPVSQAPAGSADAGLTWSARLTGRNHVHVLVVNAGNRHVRLSDARIYADASKQQLVGMQTLPSYLLAGAERSFDLTASKSLVLPTLLISGAGADPFNVVVPVMAAAPSASP